MVVFRVWVALLVVGPCGKVSLPCWHIVPPRACRWFEWLTEESEEEEESESDEEDMSDIVRPDNSTTLR